MVSLQERSQSSSLFGRGTARVFRVEHDVERLSRERPDIRDDLLSPSLSLSLIIETDISHWESRDDVEL